MVQSKQQQNNALYLPLHPQEIYILNLATLSSVLDPSLTLHLRPDGQTGWVSQSLSLRLAGKNHLESDLKVYNRSDSLCRMARRCQRNIVSRDALF